MDVKVALLGKIDLLLRLIHGETSMFRLLLLLLQLLFSKRI